MMWAVFSWLLENTQSCLAKPNVHCPSFTYSFIHLNIVTFSYLPKWVSPFVLAWIAFSVFNYLHKEKTKKKVKESLKPLKSRRSEWNWWLSKRRKHWWNVRFSFQHRPDFAFHSIMVFPAWIFFFFWFVAKRKTERKNSWIDLYWAVQTLQNAPETLFNVTLIQIRGWTIGMSSFWVQMTKEMWNKKTEKKNIGISAHNNYAAATFQNSEIGAVILRSPKK